MKKSITLAARCVAAASLIAATAISAHAAAEPPAQHAATDNNNAPAVVPAAPTLQHEREQFTHDKPVTFKGARGMQRKKIGKPN